MKVKIQFDWWCNSRENILFNHEADLKKYALNHIFDKMKNGFSSGQMYCTLSDNKVEIEYIGWWFTIELKSENTC